MTIVNLRITNAQFTDVLLIRNVICSPYCPLLRMDHYARIIAKDHRGMDPQLQERPPVLLLSSLIFCLQYYLVQ